MPIVTMYDTIGRDSMRIPAGAEKVAGYVTGSPDIIWTTSDWEKFARAGRVRIDQSPDGALYQNGHADVHDIERLAGTPEKFAGLAVRRHARGWPNCPYGSTVALQAAAAALDAIHYDNAPPGWWHGMDAWLANPDLSIAEADALVGKPYLGFILRAVQWATPRSNPNTGVIGGTLASLNLDLSVADSTWFPAPPVPPELGWLQPVLTTARALKDDIDGLIMALEAHQ
jgi:hypothetical protein